MNEAVRRFTLAAQIRGEALLLSLSDGLDVAELGLVPDARARLSVLRRSVCDDRADRGHEEDSDRNSRWHALSRQLAGQLLADDVARALFSAQPGGLTLQITSALAWVPWELMSDADATLGECLPIVRNLICASGQAARRDTRVDGGQFLRVLVLSGAESPAGDLLVHGLVARLRAMAGIAISVARLRDIDPGELQTLAEVDILHYAGPLAGERPAQWMTRAPLDLAALMTLAPIPGLVIAQGTGPAGVPADPDPSQPLAAEACRAGRTLLICHGSDQAGTSTFMARLYDALLHGATTAEAVRVARAAVRVAHGLALLADQRPELYGRGHAAPFGPERAERSQAEVRQVTSMSIDLVGSTRLLDSLGAERYSELLADFHRRSTEILQSHGGTPDAPQGDDGSMCYFGLPTAREDAAISALRAGWEVIAAVRALGLDVRIGVCTGEVVVRDGQAVGPSIHLAARFQAAAMPGTMAVGDSTRRLARNRFRFEPLPIGEPLKGFEHHEACYRAVGPVAPDESADADARAASLTPFVGRVRELGALFAHWDAARAGALRVVRIVGDAGIGKSRLAREFMRHLAEQGIRVFDCRCDPEYANSAFRPLIDALRAELRMHPTDRSDALRDRLLYVVGGAELVGDAELALLANLLGVPMPSRDAVLDLPAERLRRMTIDLLVELARAQVRDAPGCMIVEDLHWVDPSTADYLNRLAQAARTLPLLVLLTARPEVEPRWVPRTPVHEMELRGLAPDSARALVEAACGERRLPRDVVHAIAARADGVPLFIEESARMAIECGRPGADSDVKRRAEVPTLILDLLTSRLDGLGSAKQIAQVGAAIGREFPQTLLSAVLEHPGSPIDGRDLDDRLAALQRSGVVRARTDADETRFAFKHALMRDAAYRSMLSRDRARWHRVIAEVLRDRFPEIGAQQPELLATHCAEAGDHAAAVQCWELAARQAAARSAQLEALAHVQSALDALAHAPPGRERDGQELRLQLMKAARMIATYGYGAEKVAAAYGRARELARALEDRSALQRVLLGLEGYHFMRADFAQARACVLEAAACAGPNVPAIQQIQTQWALANAQMHQGDMEPAVAQMDDCLARYEALDHRPDAVQDPGVMCLCYSAWSKWQLGFPDEALQRAQRVVRVAEHLKHKFSLGEAFGFLAAVRHFRGENREALRSADRAIAICEEGGFSVWLAHARVMRGRALAELGEGWAGIEEMREGCELWASTGAVVTLPFYLTMRAEGLALCGRIDEAAVLLGQALEIVERTGERYYESEIRRHLGRLCRLAAADVADRPEEAQTWLHQALTLARERRMHSLTLRAAADLADLHATAGRPAQALEVLQPAYDAITEGRDTRDLVDAARRLEALRRDLRP